jgi:peptidoglycan-associated lipoprotein
VLRAVNGQLEDAFFPYDRSELTGQALTALRRDAAILAPLLAEFPTIRIIVEGHCDERGSAEYNLALGDRRAMQASEVLQRFGIAADRAAPISYGKERPQCTEANEDCRQRNRRAHLSVVQTPDTR